MKKNHYVVKANNLIEAKGRMEFTLLEQKLLLALISEIKIDDGDLYTYEIDIRKFLNLSGTEKIGGKDYKTIHKTAEKLMEKVVTLNKPNGGRLTIAFLSSAETTEGSGILELGFDKKLKPYLLELKGEFTSYQLKNVLSLNSGYSIRIYELLKQYQTIGHRTISLIELKEFLGIENRYARFFDFEKRVLLVAEKEINKVTDINISYEKIRRSRSIDKIKFSIQSSTKKSFEEQFLENDKEYISNIKSKMNLNENFNAKQLNELYSIAVKMTENSKVDVFEYIRVNYNHIKGKNGVQSKFGLLRKALQDDFANVKNQLKIEI